MEGTNGSNSDTYVLPTGSIGAARLLMQDELYGASTRTMMLDRGLRPGMRVLDLPCGTGTVSGWIAQRVGEQGSVVGADIDRDQLWVAQSQCGGMPQLEFMEANVYATGFPAGHFDMVHCRLLLCHLQQPMDALREFHRVLKPGGVLVCQDVCFSTCFSSPPSQAYEQSLALARALGKALGTNYDFGTQLHSAMMQAGFGSLTVSFTQPVFMSGKGKSWCLDTFAEATPSIIGNELATREEIAVLLAEMKRVVDDENTLLAQACMPAVSALK